MYRIAVFCLALMVCFSSRAQKTKASRYPSLLWEITGNGLGKPSYLFGTMHVSSKMVFHLSDSFYHAIQNCDMVALELNPYYWQRDMMTMEASQRRLNDYVGRTANSFITESSFRLEKYEDNLKAALTEDPTMINGLLYRSVQSQADYEESTYLDLYIYQTGRKLGKKPGGVEDYYQTEQLVFESYQDMAREKNKKRPDTDGVSLGDIQKKIQEAYRRGDLDMLDSLEKFTYSSPAFIEKFLYKRNDIQAASMDSILQHQSLFVGVGAAHLPGPRGVIELLRKKGYQLRPIIMQDRDADRKEAIARIRVPVNFEAVSTDDDAITMQLPGPLYKRTDTYVSLNSGSWQYADMDNGAYYMLTRVKTRSAINGESTKEVMKKIDSLLYENIPGKIIRKTAIVKNGYPGFDITNRTRRGDLQRYNIIATPFEVLVFKMSGNDDYVDGQEAATFFNSIQIANHEKKWLDFQPAQGDFTVSLPQQPIISRNTGNKDRVIRWEYEAQDSATQSAYFIWKKTINSYTYLEEDTFDLSLVEESLKKSECISRETKRTLIRQDGYQALDMTFDLKNGQVMQARAILRGQHYYVVAATGPRKNAATASRYLQSFHLTSFQYGTPALFTDTLFHFSVRTPVAPVLDQRLVHMMSETMDEKFREEVYGYYEYWPPERYAAFRSDTTGEVVIVKVQEYPRYFTAKDTAKFWKDELNEKQYKNMVVASRLPLQLINGCTGYEVEIRDTNTARTLIRRHLQKDNYVYTLTTLTDTLTQRSAFLRGFFDSFTPDPQKLGSSVFDNKVDRFFADYNSKDSVVRKRARASISHVYFTSKDLGKITSAVRRLSYGDKGYFEMKSAFINELGFLEDICCRDSVVKQLALLYAETADTSYFQNEVLRALARLKTSASYDTLKELLLQDPPVFDEGFSESDLFDHLEDSLALTRRLFPELLQLASLEDYKTAVTGLLREMKDSGQIEAKDYEDYYSKLYFDAKIELKRQQAKEEKMLQKESKQEEDNDADVRGVSSDLSSSDLTNYAVLLAPYYQKNAAVARYFEKLLRSKDPEVQLQAAIIMIGQQYRVPDTLWGSLAARDSYRARLLEQLEKIKRTDLLPAAYKKQPLLARAILMHSEGYEKLDSIAVITTQKARIKEKEGLVYFFKYRIKKDDDWKLAICGLQPVNGKDVSSEDDISKLTDRKVKTGSELEELMQSELRKLLYAKRQSASKFFEDERDRTYYED